MAVDVRSEMLGTDGISQSLKFSKFGSK